MKLDPGFVKANSGNLPEINIFMVYEFIKNDSRFSDPEVRNAKANLSSRKSYGDSAIGYVSVYRKDNICILKAKICPEQRIHNTPYSVTMKVNEKEKVIDSVECEDCTASLGGCKHAIAFLMWTHRRSEEPSPTEIACYWKKSTLANVVTGKQYVAAANLCKKSDKENITDQLELKKHLFFTSVIDTAKHKMLHSQLSIHCFDLKENFIKCLSMHELMINFADSQKRSAIDFLVYAKNIMTEPLCKEVEQLTRNQSDNRLWFELRYGRITASKIYEAAHCKTPEGSLVNEIIGVSKLFVTKALARGKDLENEVLKAVKEKEGINYNKCGLYLLPSFPVLGASPDGIGSDFIIEVKCPATVQGFNRFLPKGNISEKCKAQMYLQMLCTNKKKGLFCVADPDFEKNRKVTTMWLTYNEQFISVIENATQFWLQCVYHRLLQSVS